MSDFNHTLIPGYLIARNISKIYLAVSAVAIVLIFPIVKTRDFVLWEISKNQFGRPKKRSTKILIFFENQPPSRKS